jgi:hypothetical protein
MKVEHLEQICEAAPGLVFLLLGVLIGLFIASAVIWSLA